MPTRRFFILLALLCLATLASAQTDQPEKPKLHISSGTAESYKIHGTQPIYPKEAQEKGIHGSVLLQATITKEGRVVDIKILRGDPNLTAAAINTVKHWKYRPYLFQGKPVEVDTVIKLIFDMRG